MNELVEDGVNGLLVRGIETGRTKSGIPAFEPDFDELTAAVTRLADDELRAELSRGALRMRERWSWDRARRGYAGLIESVTTSSSAGAAQTAR
jgi:glycosyltransferase involved in cell wall biosynthesis